MVDKKIKGEVELIPPDLERCQAETARYRPFVMGGAVNEVVRCVRRPVWLASETTPAADGLCGSMAMCEECKDALMVDVRYSHRVKLERLNTEQPGA